METAEGARICAKCYERLETRCVACELKTEQPVRTQFYHEGDPAGSYCQGPPRCYRCFARAKLTTIPQFVPSPQEPRRF